MLDVVIQQVLYAAVHNCWRWTGNIRGLRGDYNSRRLTFLAKCPTTLISTLYRMSDQIKGQYGFCDFCLIISVESQSPLLNILCKFIHT